MTNIPTTMTNKCALDALKLVVVCIFWYISSAGGNVIGKLVLNEFPYPATMTMIQLSTGAICLGPILRLMGIPPPGEISRSYFLTMIIPLAFGKFIASCSSHISIWKVSVSYAHTVKATLPLFTVLLMRIFFKEKQKLHVYLSLVPIISGVCIATVTEISFDIIGLCSALFATLGFSIQTIFSKKTLKDTGIHHMNLLLILSRYSTLFFLPIWLLVDVTRIVHDDNVLLHSDKAFAVSLMLLDGLLSLLQNIFAFTVLAMVNPLSYAVANATKRIVIIGASLVLLKNPVTATNVIGMLVAVMGVLLYNKAKYDQNQTDMRKLALPYVQSTNDLQYRADMDRLARVKSNHGQNGYVNNQLLLGNDDDIDRVTLMPVSNNTGYDRTANDKVSHDLHARSHNIQHV